MLPWFYCGPLLASLTSVFLSDPSSSRRCYVYLTVAPSGHLGDTTVVLLWPSFGQLQDFYRSCSSTVGQSVFLLGLLLGFRRFFIDSSQLVLFPLLPSRDFHKGSFRSFDFQRSQIAHSLGDKDYGTFSIKLSLLLGLEAIEKRVRSYSYWIVRFPSPVSHLSWEVFH